jgi:hypothetical protein
VCDVSQVAGGAGTCALEILAELQPLGASTAVFIPVGGGGLCAGAQLRWLTLLSVGYRKAGAGTCVAQARDDSMPCAARAHFLSLTSAAMTRRNGSGAQVGGPKHQGIWVPAGCQQCDAGFGGSRPHTGPAQ